MIDFFKKEHLPIWVILVLGFFVRIIGINFGLPDLYHADEPIIVNHAVAYGTGDLNPHFFKIPPLVSYLLFMCYGVYFALGRAVGFFSELEDFQNLFLTDPTNFYLIGRIIFGVLCGTATIYVFYRLLNRFFSRTHALLGSFLLAFTFLHVRDSHYVYTDIPLLLVLVASFFPILKIAENGNKKDYVLFGILLGMAVATKYNGVFIMAPFLMAHVYRKGEKWLDSNLLVGVGCSLFSYVILNPFSLLDFNFFLSELRGQGKAEAFVGFFHHLIYSLNGAVGFPILLFAVIGMGVAVSFFKLDFKRLILCFFIWVYYLILCLFSQPYDRYVLPLLPFVIFFSTDSLLFIKEKFNLTSFATSFLVLVLILPNAVKIYFSNLLFLEKDVRTVAREWIESHLPSESRVALDVPFFMPRLKSSLAQLKEKQGEILREEGHGDSAQTERIELMIKNAQESLMPRHHLFFMKTNLEGSFLFSNPALPYYL